MGCDAVFLVGMEKGKEKQMINEEDTGGHMAI